MRLLRIVAAILSISMLSGCAALSDLKSALTPTRPADLPATQSLAGVEAAAASDGEWWRRFGDPQLNALVEDAFKGSPTLQVALARVARARAVAGVVAAAAKPTLDLNFTADRERFSENYLFPPPLGGSYWNPARLAGDFQYEFDFWGRNKARREGALSEVQAASAEAAASRLMLAASVCQVYVALDREFAVQDLLERLALQRRDALRLVDLRVGAGLEPSTSHERAVAQLAAISGLRAAAEERQTALRHQLAALLGAGPDRGLEIKRPALVDAGKLSFPSRLPADLIGRRPDVVALRARVEAAGKYSEAAKADFYPDINLVAFVGLQSIDIGDLLRAGSREMGIGPAIHLPLFNGGRLRQQLAARHAEEDVAIAEYNQSLSDALREIADVVSRWRALELRQAEQSTVTTHIRSTRDHARQRYDSGLIDRLGAIAAEVELIGEEARDIDLRAERFSAAVELAHAVGGGYAAPGPAYTPPEQP